MKKALTEAQCLAKAQENLVLARQCHGKLRRLYRRLAALWQQQAEKISTAAASIAKQGADERVD